MHSDAPPSSRLLFVLCLIAAVVWFGNLDYRKLVRPDEGRYAEIPREMVASGDWLTPRLNGLKYFEKPPLQYWATATAYQAFGMRHFSARLWPALTGALGLLIVALAGRRLFGARAGLAAGCVLASSLLYTLIGHVNTLDMGLTFFLGGALCSFLLAQTGDPQRARRWMLLAWAAAACATLSKGLVGIALPALAVAAYSLVTRQFEIWTRLALIPGLALYLLIAAPWFVLVSIENPAFPQFFFLHEHFLRFLTEAHRRVQPWWYFGPVLLLGVMPWILVAADALVAAGRAATRGARFEPRTFLLCWCIAILAFFSFSGSKLPSYILPMFPALALLIGARLAEIDGARLARQMAWLAPLALAALVASFYVDRLASPVTPLDLYLRYRLWLVAGAATLLAGLLAACWLAYRRGPVTATFACAMAALFAWQMVLTGHDALSPSSSSYHLVREARAELRPDAPFYSVGTYEQTLPFYIGRTVTQVEFLDELAFGAKLEPERWIASREEFARRWRLHDFALGITTPEVLAELERMGLPLRVVAADTRRVIFRTP